MDLGMRFSSEKQLFNTALSSTYFKNLVKPPSTRLLVEPKGLFGIPDLVIAFVSSFESDSPEIAGIAFEMKLSKWKRALFQAYRYRSFAKKSYVVMDHYHIKPALLQISLFEKSNIGLLSLSQSGHVYVHFDPAEDTPYCDSTRARFEKLVKDHTTNVPLEVATKLRAIHFSIPTVYAG